MGYSFYKPKQDYNIFISGCEDKRAIPEMPRAGRCWKENTQGGTHQIRVLYPAGPVWGWTTATPVDVLAAIDYLSRVLMVAVDWSPQNIGTRFLKRLHSENLSWLDPLTGGEAIEKTMKQADRDVIFPQNDTPQLTNAHIGQWYHYYDISSHHPAEARYMYSGIGQPIHVARWVEEEMGSPVKQGIYRVTYQKNGSIYDGKCLPLIIEQDWVNLQVLRFARQHGYTVDIKEAWCFETSKRLFDAWSPLLWEARCQLREDTKKYTHPAGTENALTTIKQVMNFTISSLRANWWQDMVSQARVSILSRVGKLAELGYKPLLIYYDGVGYVSKNADPRQAIPGICRKEGELGGFRSEYSFQLTEAMIKKMNKIRNGGELLTYCHTIADKLGLR